MDVLKAICSILFFAKERTPVSKLSLQKKRRACQVHVSIQNGGTVFAHECIGRRDTRNLQREKEWGEVGERRRGGGRRGGTPPLSPWRRSEWRLRGGGGRGRTPHPPFSSSPPPPLCVWRPLWSWVLWLNMTDTWRRWGEGLKMESIMGH